MIRHSTIAVSFLLTAICCFAYAQSEADLSASKTAALIEQLSDPSFETRQRASDALVAIGADAEPELTEALKSDDPEVQSRCRLILKGIYESQIVERRNAFIAGDINRLKQNIESWKAFEKLVGNSEESRKMFVDIQLSYGELLEMLESNDPNCGEAINQLCIEKSPTFGSEGKEADRILVASIAFTGSQGMLEPAIGVCRGTGKLMYYGKLYGHDDRMIRTLLGAWVERGSTSSGKFRLLYAATAYDLDEAVALARVMIADRSLSPKAAIRVLSDRGTIEDIELIEPWIWDENSQKTRRYNKSEIESSTGDQALAACVKLSGQQLKDFGIVKPYEAAGEVYGFENGDKRNEALSKWKEYRKTTAESR